MAERILIARGGEIGARVARTCKRLGGTAFVRVATPEETGVHVEAADEVRHLADLAAIAEAAGELQCVHPGYADHAFAAALRGALPEDVRFVGPTAAALERVRDRHALLRAAEEDSIRIVPTSDVVESAAAATNAADTLEYPVRLRAQHASTDLVAVICEDDEALTGAFPALAAEATRRETALVVERFFERAREVRVLLVSDASGETLALAEIETTLRGEHGIVLEESPAPFLASRPDGEAMRFALFDVAIRVVQPLASPGLSTVTFLFDADNRAFVSDVELGLPRAHATAELVTGLDLVAIEMGLAKGESIPDEVHAVQPSGAALFASIHAEGPAERRLIETFRSPPAPQRKIRVDTSVLDEAQTSDDDGALLCRIGSYAPIRHQALLLLDRQIAETEISRVRTNQRFLRGVLADESVRAGQYDVTSPGRIKPFS